MPRENAIDLLRESFIYEKFQLLAMIGEEDPLPCNVLSHTDADVLQLLGLPRSRKKKSKSKSKKKKATAAKTAASGLSSPTPPPVQGLRRSRRKTAPKNLLSNSEAYDRQMDPKLSCLPIVRVVPLSMKSFKTLTAKHFVTLHSTGLKEKSTLQRDSRDVDLDRSFNIQPLKK
jgi:hypothetical protein